MNIIGIDLAKDKFSICVMNKQGRVLKRANSRRNDLIKTVLQLGHGTIAVEACGGAHDWARRFKSHGYEVKIIAPQFVKPFVKSQKNDRIDAEAICEAANRPQMRYVSARTKEQQDIQNLHRIREKLKRNQVSLANEIRGLLLEYGIVIPQGIHNVRNRLPAIIEEHAADQSARWKYTFTNLYQELVHLNEQIDEYDKHLEAYAKTDDTAKRITAIPGVGTLISTAIVAAVGNPKDFKNGRQFAAWLGLVPKQSSTGGKEILGSITKRGNKYIRKLLVQGACSYAVAAVRTRNHKDPLRTTLDLTQTWLIKVAARRGGNRARVALANKMARRIFVVLRGDHFKRQEELLKLAA